MKVRMATTCCIATAIVSGVVAYSPPAVAEPACPDPNNQAEVDAASEPFHQRYNNGDGQAAIDLANFLSACARGEPYVPGDRIVDPVARPDLSPPVQPPEANQPSSGVDCTQLRDAYDSLGPVVDVGEAVGRINKLPGLSQVQAASLALCGIDAIPNAIANPTDANQQRVADAGCGTLNYLTNGLVNLCGDTSVGSH